MSISLIIVVEYTNKVLSSLVIIWRKSEK